jgi:hypothetical protein
MVGKGGEETYLIRSPSVSCTWLKLYCLNPNRVVSTETYTIMVLVGVCDDISRSLEAGYKHLITAASLF